MWVKPREVLVSGPMWSVERANQLFMLQRRKGRGKSSSSSSGGGGVMGMLVGTFDAVMDTKPPTYRYKEQSVP